MTMAMMRATSKAFPAGLSMATCRPAARNPPSGCSSWSDVRLVAGDEGQELRDLDHVLAR